MPKESSQIEKFKEAARALECDDDEARFNANLRRIAKAKSKPKEEKPEKE